MNTSHKLPSLLRQTLQTELKQGEKIKWMRSPIPAAYALRALPVTIFGIITTIFMIFWMGGAVDFKIPDPSNPLDLFALFLFLCGVPGLVISITLAGYPLRVFKKADLVLYVITDQRAIIFDGTLQKVKIRSFYPHQFEKNTKKVKGDGSGNLIFAEEAPHDQSGGNIFSPAQAIIQGPGFYAIPNVNKVERLLAPLLKNKDNPYALSQSDDAVTDKITWKPLNTSSFNFDPYKLSTGNKELLKYSPALGAKAFSGLFMALGIGCLSYVGPRQHGRWLPESFVEEGLGQLVSLLFLIAGASLLYILSSPRLFDGKKKIFRKGRGGKQKIISFSDIYALQFLPRSVSNSDGRDYTNYQLNIILNNGKRENVVNYHNRKNALADAKTISEFIGKKVFSPPA
ncbi:MAG: hypothetical protein D3925_03840 [Candidatus Electrothrix sp. AR5]|nr:hypothetical protein [Candidatus Electrothrix sp. AR5]